MKYPKNLDDPSTFRLYFFGYNDPVTSSIDSSPVSVRVEDRQPSLSVVYPIGITQGELISNAYLLSVNVLNDGDVPVKVTRVRPLADGSSAGPFSSLYCTLYGIPPTICPSGNGFEQTIAPGNTQLLQISYRGNFVGDIVNITYVPLDKICSAQTEFGVKVHIDGGTTPVRCAIEPASLALTPFEIHEWKVICYNDIGLHVPCIGTNWYFGTDTDGSFLTKTNAHAIAYLESTTRSAWIPDHLFYETGAVKCSASIWSYPAKDSRDPNSFVCTLSPDSADLKIGENQSFKLDCSLEGVPVDPTSADYSNVHGLDGTLSDASTDGVTFTATTNGSGDVQVIAWYSTSADPTLLGAIDWANVTVGEGGTCSNVCGSDETQNPYPDCTCKTNGNPDKGDQCKIVPNYIEKYPHDFGSVGILCGDNESRAPCSSSVDVTWEIADELHGSKITENRSGLAFTIGSTGTPEYSSISEAIIAIISSRGDVLGHCWADILIKEANCLDYT